MRNSCSSRWLGVLLIVSHALAVCLSAGELGRGDTSLAAYLKAETDRLSAACLADVPSLEQWKAQREVLRAQLFEMLGLAPLPPRTDLKATVTGVLQQEDFSVEKLHFQSMPGLYVTANLYLPKGLKKLAPAILYGCGHALVRTNGVSYGNKTAYQHHGVWFARNGYVCLVLDTIQLGEIEGLHHGTYREGMWWWNARGYTPAGVEAWNCIRALDYLQSRPEVDPERLGVTGRSGGGAYSWWTAALDERIKVAAPVAGVTDLHNHVIDGTVDGHCDCMFFVNTYRWDYPLLAALVAPRPLLICNSDKDSIFPLDGVVRLHEKVASVYKLCNATNSLGLLITDGPHKDTQDLQLPVFRWFNRHLKGEDPVIEMAARPAFTPQQLKVFENLPADERTTTIQESFVPMPSFKDVPSKASEWAQQRDAWKTALRDKVFRGWPASPPPLALRSVFREQTPSGDIEAYEFDSQEHVPLRLYLLRGKESASVNSVRLVIRDSAGWSNWVGAAGAVFTSALREELEAVRTHGEARATGLKFPPRGQVEVCFSPRGIGWDAWDPDPRRQVQIRRRFMLLGQTVDGMRVWDIRRAVQAVRAMEGMHDANLTVEAAGEFGVDALYASVFDGGVQRLRLTGLPASHRAGPDYLNVLRFLDVPQAVALACESSSVELTSLEPGNWEYPAALGRRLGWPEDRLKVTMMDRESAERK
jgi:hypothetical protein